MEKARRYNKGKRKWSLVHFKSLEPMVEVLEYGLEKYTVKKGDKIISSGLDNWKKPMDKKEILESAMRHLVAMMDDEEIDPESGKLHAGHLQANIMIYNYQKENYK